jgi:hypothetical protein
MNQLRRAVFLALAAGIPGNAPASELVPLHWVPAERDVVVVMNVPAVLDSTPVQRLEQQVNLTDLYDKLHTLEEWTGFQLPRDLDRVIVAKFEKRNREDIVFLEGVFDESRILETLRWNTQYASSEHRGVTIHSWFDDNERRQKYGAFLTANIILIGTETGVKQVIDTRARPATSFGARPEIQRALASLTTEPAIWCVARNTGKGGFKELPVFLATINLNPDFSFVLTAAAPDESTARNVAMLANGLVALGKLATGKPEIQALAEGAFVHRDGLVVTLSTVVPEAKFTEWRIQQAKVNHAAN